jgi:hypothetical protein
MVMVPSAAVEEAHKLLLATFIVARDPNELPPLSDTLYVFRPNLAARDDWAAALGLDPAAVIQQFIAEGLLELKQRKTLFVLKVLTPKDSTVAQLTEKGVRVVHEYLDEIRASTMRHQLDKRRVKNVLQWVAAGAATGVIGNRVDALGLKLLDILGDAIRKVGGRNEGVDITQQLPSQTTQAISLASPSPSPVPIQSNMGDPLIAAAVVVFLLLARGVGKIRRLR